MNNTGPITHNGIHPITGKAVTVVKEGVAGSAKAATPKASQIAGEGAKHQDASGTRLKEGKQEKSMAQVMYPQKLGIRGVVAE